MNQKNVRNWKEFRLTITDPPSYQGHFKLIKKHLMPFIEKTRLHFWVTNYFDPSGDSILFRVKVDEKEQKSVEDLLRDLEKQKKIVRWDPSKDWNPKNDAENRITSASGKLGLPQDTAMAVQGPYIGLQESTFEERVRQLEMIFTEAVGPCTKVLYKALESKPTDPWMMSLFVHLLLNSLDISGPNPPSEETNIRYMPAY